MVEAFIPHEEGKKKLEELRRKVENNEPIVEPSVEDINNELQMNTKSKEKSPNDELSSRLRPFTEEDRDRIQRQFPDTF